MEKCIEFAKLNVMSELENLSDTEVVCCEQVNVVGR
jgi:hypothetical protein